MEATNQEYRCGVWALTDKGQDLDESQIMPLRAEALRLCDLLKEYKLGVTTAVRQIEDVQIDPAYFTEI